MAMLLRLLKNMTIEFKFLKISIKERLALLADFIAPKPQSDLLASSLQRHDIFFLVYDA